jgi:predicted nuclease of predicted toxin-antitoxin system
MLFKIDENLHADTADLLRRHGHDAMTAYEQGLQGEVDVNIAGVCRREARAIVTLDLDFADIREYPPEQYAGIIVLRLKDQSRASVLNIIGRMIPLFDAEPLVGHLWIVQETGVRIRDGKGNAAQ